MAYIGVSPSNGVRTVFDYTATAGQTSFSGSDNNSQTLSYTDSAYIDVYQNGVLLIPSDYTATTGTSVVLDTGATVSDSVQIVVYDVFSVADTVSKANGGTFESNISIGGTLGVTGNQTNNGNLVVSKATPNVDIKDTGTAQASMDFLSNSDTVRATIGMERSAGGGLFVGSSAYAAVFGTASSGNTEFATNNNIQMKIDSAGHVTMPNQSAFLLQASGQTNLSTNATTTIGFSAIFDQNSDFDSSTETFTAPVTGKYQFNVFLRVDQVDNTSQYTTVRIETTNRTIYGIWTNNGYDADLDYITYGIAQLMDMDAGDTAKITIYLPSLGTAQLDVTDASFWSGYLVC